jgi:anthranilate/para-aminobenzoate synthase component I
MKAEISGDKKSYHVYNRYKKSKEVLALDHDLYDAALFVIDSALRIVNKGGDNNKINADIKESLVSLKTFEEYISKYEHDSEMKNEVIENSDLECITKHNNLVKEFNEKIPKFKDVIDNGRISEVVSILQEYRGLFFPLVYVDHVENVH